MTSDERKFILALSGLAPKTLRRIERGEPVKDVSLRRAEIAARDLGIALSSLKQGGNDAV